MTREEFERELKSLEVQISDLQYKKRKLYQQFSENNPYKHLSGKTVQIVRNYRNVSTKSEPFIFERVVVDDNGFISAYGRVGKREVAFSLTSNNTEIVEV